MSRYHAIIRYPSITEKNTILRSEENKYVFEVVKSAKKPEIKKAIEALFSVNVMAVNTMIVKGKKKRMGRNAGYRSDWKKAIVKVQEGQQIAKFGEV
jgi:large subunit ribosomal protein L23